MNTNRKILSSDDWVSRIVYRSLVKRPVYNRLRSYKVNNFYSRDALDVYEYLQWISKFVYQFFISDMKRYGRPIFTEWLCINEIYQLCQIAPSHIGNLKQKEAMDSYVYELSLSSDRNDTV